MKTKINGLMIFLTSMVISTVVFFNAFPYPKKFEIVQETKYYDLVVTRQESGYFEFVFNPAFGKAIEIIINKDAFSR